MTTHFDILIIGGSYAGLSAAMALGRSLRKVLIIDSGQPCNRQTPHSHNFITHDGATPHAIAAKAKEQVLKYDTVTFLSARAVSGAKAPDGFSVETDTGEVFGARKLLFATCLRDIMPPIPGFAECWGISVLHCPYCHGYEVRGENTAVLANGDMGFEFVKMIRHWTPQLTLFTNGKSTLSEEQENTIKKLGISIVETELAEIEHRQGQVQRVAFTDGTSREVKVVYAKIPFEQHCEIPGQLGCELDEHGFIKVDDFHKTTVPGVYAAGDNAGMFRAVSIAVAAGTKAGALLNKELIDEQLLQPRLNEYVG